jgi:alanine racemase
LGTNYQFDLVRPGIGLYGGSPNPVDPKGFQPVVIWQAQILELQEVNLGETVGYGGSFVAHQRMQLATIGVGYADGYLRVLSGRGEVAIDGERCPIAGRVSMDLVTIDVSRLSGLRVGTWVEIMGPTISLDALATKANTIGYEVLSRLGSRMERDIV